MIAQWDHRVTHRDQEHPHTVRGLRRFVRRLRGPNLAPNVALWRRLRLAGRLQRILRCRSQGGGQVDEWALPDLIKHLHCFVTCVQPGLHRERGPLRVHAVPDKIACEAEGSPERGAISFARPARRLSDLSRGPTVWRRVSPFQESATRLSDLGAVDGERKLSANSIARVYAIARSARRLECRHGNAPAASRQCECGDEMSVFRSRAMPRRTQPFRQQHAVRHA